jgi:2-polyprenyl-3-methyl-5-hydroxy-6-metoxy-1,4-benzoquinol methylase
MENILARTGFGDQRAPLGRSICSIMSIPIFPSSAMEPNEFVAEVYRRMSQRYPGERRRPTLPEIQNQQVVLQAVHEYVSLLPSDKNAPILDIGFGSGWFIAACLKLGYTNISGADFGISHKAHVREWAPQAVSLFEIERDIGDFLADRPAEQYEFIHLSHVIEHIPKHSLFWVVDAIFRALRRGGVLLLRTPNMDGPTPNSSLYVTLAHEYGFSGSNLASLLGICGFDDVTIHRIPVLHRTFKQVVGGFMRWPFIQYSRLKHRLFGVSVGGQFGNELVVSGKRGDAPPFFDRKYR